MTTTTPYPLQFRPLIKQTIWGGSKLGTLLGKSVGDEGNYAESWEIVDHGDDQSVVTEGALAGKTLAELVKADPAWLLGDASVTSFPLLLKYLDCNRVLSVQVHPDDEYGSKMPVPDLGKTEAWYVVAAEPGSLIYAGLQSGVGRTELAEAVAAGQTDSVLHSFEASPGDCVFIPAGTVHALGAGLVIAEIQQSSDTTFRLFDWNRVGADGLPRPLHIEQSLDVSDYESGPVAAQGSDPTEEGWQTLVECDKFVLKSLERGQGQLSDTNRCQIVTVPKGVARIESSSGRWKVTTGQSILVPAAMDECSITVEENSTALMAEPVL